VTLQNGLVHGDRAYLWCDTAYYNIGTSELIGFDSKAFQGVTWPFAGICSCLGGNPHSLVEEIGDCWPLGPQQLLDVTARALKGYAAKGNMARILLALWHDRPQIWLIGTDDCGGDGPFVATECLHYVNAGNDLPEYHRAARKGFTPERMAYVIDAQLAAPPVIAAGEAGANGYRVQYGGNVVEIEVTRRGVDSRVLRAV
jgi:hypothetical protein